MRQANEIDFWRGFALVTIFINHIPGGLLERFTHKNLGFSDSAEMFVFLAGWSLARVVGGSEGISPVRLALRLGGRGMVLWVAQMTITAVALAILAALSLWRNDPLVLEWNNAAAVFQDPVSAHIGIVVLGHQLGYFDILPLYVVLMLGAPVLGVMFRLAPRAVLPLSLTIYMVAIVTGANLPTWPVEGRWYFNPFCWQLTFVLGFLAANPTGILRRVVAWRGTRGVAIAYLVIAAVLTLRGWSPDPLAVPSPTLLFILDKSFESPGRLLHFLALAVAFRGAFAAMSAWLGPLPDFLSMLGRNSLNVFCVGSILSLCGQAVHYVSNGNAMLDVTVVVCGVAVLGLTGWVSEWRERLRESSPRPGRS